MAFVFTMPTDVLLVVLSEWIEVDDLARFDSAVCNSQKQERAQFLDLVAEDCFILSCEVLTERLDLAWNFESLGYGDTSGYHRWLDCAQLLRNVNIYNVLNCGGSSRSPTRFYTV